MNPSDGFVLIFIDLGSGLESGANRLARSRLAIDEYEAADTRG